MNLRDSCELYVQKKGNAVKKSIVVERDESMGRVRAASNFIQTIGGKEKPLNTIDQPIKLMKIVDAIYKSAKTGATVKLIKNMNYISHGVFHSCETL